MTNATLTALLEKCTPEPWELEDGQYGIPICHNGGSFIACWPESASGVMHDARANAELISLAPAMARRIIELEAGLREAQRALKPMANCVFDDNGDHTVHHAIFDCDYYSAAYVAERKASALLSGELK